MIFGLEYNMTYNTIQTFTILLWYKTVPSFWHRPGQPSQLPLLQPSLPEQHSQMRPKQQLPLLRPSRPAQPSLRDYLDCETKKKSAHNCNFEHIYSSRDLHYYTRLCVKKMWELWTFWAQLRNFGFISRFHKLSISLSHKIETFTRCCVISFLLVVATAVQLF